MPITIQFNRWVCMVAGIYVSGCCGFLYGFARYSAEWQVQLGWQPDQVDRLRACGNVASYVGIFAGLFYDRCTDYLSSFSLPPRPLFSLVISLLSVSCSDTLWAVRFGPRPTMWVGTVLAAASMFTLYATVNPAVSVHLPPAVVLLLYAVGFNSQTWYEPDSCQLFCALFDSLVISCKDRGVFGRFETAALMANMQNFP